jgi:FixJ family two-component response regulator
MPHIRGQHVKGPWVPAGAWIAIIDDDESMRKALMALVRSVGYLGHDFTSAIAFLASGTVQSFACVVTDIQMPGMTGIELKEHLAASQLPVPVIMITAHHDPSLEAAARASGAACFLKKPFDADTLIRCIEDAIKS